MSVVIAISNQKGGVGKTTSAVSLSSEFADRGFRTLLVDLDPQSSATSGLRIENRSEARDVYDLFIDEASLVDLVVATEIPGLWIVPGSKDLISLEMEIGKKPGRELILKSELRSIRHMFDIVIIDCPPSSGLLTLNALGAAQHVIVPLQAEYYALEGISALMSTIEFVVSTFNPTLKLLGVFLTMYDARTNLAVQVENEVKNYFGPQLFTSKIPRNVKLSESPSHGLPISRYDPSSAGAKAYVSLTGEIISRLEMDRNLSANG